MPSDGPNAADDVVSQVFATACRCRRNVPQPALPSLLGTHVVSHERRSLARRLKLRDAVAGTLTRRSAPGADAAGRSLADSVLNQLSTTDAEILRLAAWEELTPTEIALVLDLSDAAARARLMRARQRAQRLLDDSVAAPRLAVVTQLYGEPS